MTAVDDRWAWIDAAYTLDPDEPDDDEPDPDDEQPDEDQQDTEPYRRIRTLPDIANYQNRTIT